MQNIVNIITPIHNGEDTIARVYNSLKEQTHPHWRWIVVDDYSIDSSFYILSKIEQSDHRVFTTRNVGNRGAGAARNYGLKFVQSPIISFVDADDEWDSDFLEKILPFVEKPYSMAFSGYRRKGIGGSQVTEFIPNRTIERNDLFRGSDIACLTAVYNFNTVSEIPCFGEIRARNDLVFNLRALEIIPCAVPIDQVLATYNLSSGSISSSKMRMIYWQFLVSRMFGRSLITSIIDVIFWGLYGVKKYYF